MSIRTSRSDELGTAAQPAAHFGPGHVGEHQVEHHQIGRRALELLECLLPGCGRLDCEAGFDQGETNQFEQIGLVVDHEDSCCHGRSVSPDPWLSRSATSRHRFVAVIPRSSHGCARQHAPGASDRVRAPMRHPLRLLLALTLTCVAVTDSPAAEPQPGPARSSEDAPATRRADRPRDLRRSARQPLPRDAAERASGVRGSFGQHPRVAHDGALEDLPRRERSRDGGCLLEDGGPLHAPLRSAFLRVPGHQQRGPPRRPVRVPEQPPPHPPRQPARRARTRQRFRLRGRDPARDRGRGIQSACPTTSTMAAPVTSWRSSRWRRRTPSTRGCEAGSTRKHPVVLRTQYWDHDGIAVKEGTAPFAEVREIEGVWVPMHAEMKNLVSESWSRLADRGLRAQSGARRRRVPQRRLESH